MQSELKTCPFCGGEPEYHSDKGPTGEVYAWVGCNQCYAMSVHCDVRSMQPEETHPIEAWNTRASDAEIARLTEALHEAEDREKALRDHWAALDKALSGNIIETDQPHRVRWEGKWHYGPLADAYFAMTSAVRKLCRAALKEQPHADA